MEGLRERRGAKSLWTGVEREKGDLKVTIVGRRTGFPQNGESRRGEDARRGPDHITCPLS